MASVAVIPKDAFDEKKLINRIQDGIVPHDAISWASDNGYIEVTKMLLDAGAKVNENGNYPLELASRNGHTEIVRLLLKAGATTQDSEDEGYCLRMAAFGGYIDIVKLLLKAGANPSAGNYFALKLALNRQHMEVVEVLLDEICKQRVV